jgi:hypothetical protein
LGIQNCSNEGQCPRPRGDNNTLKLKKKSPESAGQSQSSCGSNHFWVKGIQVVQIKGQVLFKGEIITKM